MNLFERVSKFFSRPAPRASFGEVGMADPSRLFPSGSTTPYNPSELVGTQGLRIFDKMRKDDQVKAALAFKRHAVVATGWTIKPPEGKADDWEPVVFLKETLEKVEGSLEKSIMDVLTALTYGYSVTEKVWIEDDNSMLAMRALKTRRPHDFQFEVDPYGNLVGLKQMQNRLPVDKFIIYTHDGEFGNVHGTSDLEAAHRPWWSKLNAYRWMAMYLERLGIPPIFALYNPNSYPDGKIRDLRQLLENLQAATVGAIPRPAPDDLDMWTAELGKGVSEVFIPAMQMYNQDIARALLMPGLLGMTPDTDTGSYARAQVHFDVFMLVIERIRQDIARQVMNEHVVRPMCVLNFGVMDEYPCFEFNPLTDEVRTDLLTTWGTLSGQKVVTTGIDDEKHVRSMLKFPDMTAELEERRKQEEELAARQREATVQGLENPEPGNDEDDDGKPSGAAEDDKKGKKPPFKKNEYGDDPKITLISARVAEQQLKDPYCNYAQIKSDLEEMEERTLDAMTSALDDTLAALLALVKRDFDPRSPGALKWVEKLTLKTKGLSEEMQNFLRESAELGVRTIDAEVARVAENKISITVTPRAAIKAMMDKAVVVSGILRDSLTAKAKSILTAAVKNGDGVEEVAIKLKKAWEPYKGDPNVIKDEEQLEPHRLKTIVRTNMIDAYNTGRIARLRDPKMSPFIRAVRYSAVLDEVTTEICEELHDTLFEVDDPDLDRVTPPNHYNCRSLLVPVMIDQKVNQDDFKDQGTMGNVLDKIPSSFGGEKE